MSKNFYIADLHFGHKNIIRYDNRPFKTVEEMDEVLIKNWNNAVSNEDYVFILGDISWHNDNKTAQIFRQLNGIKILIKGNHDNIKSGSELAKCFTSIQDYAELYLDKKNKVIMSHYPMPFWNGQFRDSVHLYGHVHNSHQWNMCESWIEEARQYGKDSMDFIQEMYEDYLNTCDATIDESIYKLFEEVIYNTTKIGITKELEINK